MTTGPLALDHLVVAARTLDEGARWVAERTGVAPEAGGPHLGFGTHNAVLRLGQDVYLEVLARDPGQPAPAHPRLFGLDEPATRDALARGPLLLHWIVRASDLPRALARLTADADVAADAVGAPVAMRRGDLAWALTLTASGARPPGGLPSLIDWGRAAHPCTRLAERRVALERLTVTAPRASLDALADLARDPRVALAEGEPALAAVLATPRGTTVLASPDVGPPPTR